MAGRGEIADEAELGTTGRIALNDLPAQPVPTLGLGTTGKIGLGTTGKIGLGTTGKIAVSYSGEPVEGDEPKYTDQYDVQIDNAGIWPVPEDGPEPKSVGVQRDFYRLGQALVRGVGELRR